MRKLNDRFQPETTDEELLLHSQEKPGCSVESLKHFGVFCYKQEFYFPGYGKGKDGTDINVLYAFRTTSKDPKKKWLCTPTRAHQVLGFNKLKGSDTIFVCEGHSDIVALHSTFSQIDKFNDSVDIIGQAGTDFPETYIQLFSGKKVFLLYDNDDAGRAAAKAFTEKLAGANIQTASLKQLTWPEGTPKGFDIRDLCNSTKLDKASLPPAFSQVTDAKQVLKFIQSNSTRRLVIPRDASEILPEKCDTWEELAGYYQKALHTDENTFIVVSVLMAIAISTRIPGPMLWLWLIGAPGTGKTTLAECVAAAATLCHEESRITGLYSGLGKDDQGLIPIINSRTLIIKDFTTILSMQESVIQALLGQFRDIFDGHSSVRFLNGVTRSYTNVNFGTVGCTTPAIRSVSVAYLGERFLSLDMSTVVSSIGELTFNSGDSDQLCSTGISNLRSALENGFTPKALLEPKSRTWGYLEHLCSLLEDPAFVADVSSSITRETELWILALAQWVAAARATVPKGETVVRPQVEAGTRLAGQFYKLYVSLAVVRFKGAPTEEQTKELKQILLKVGFDTGYGWFLDVMTRLASNRSYTRAQLAAELGISGTFITRIIGDLNALQIITSKAEQGSQGRPSLLPILCPRYIGYAHTLGIWKSNETAPSVVTGNRRAPSPAPTSSGSLATRPSPVRGTGEAGPGGSTDQAGRSRGSFAEEATRTQLTTGRGGEASQVDSDGSRTGRGGELSGAGEVRSTRTPVTSGSLASRGNPVSLRRKE